MRPLSYVGNCGRCIFCGNLIGSNSNNSSMLIGLYCNYPNKKPKTKERKEIGKHDVVSEHGGCSEWLSEDKEQQIMEEKIKYVQQL